ncbi:MAG: glycosyltransferase family 2 protein [Hyphomicrobium sp.]|nr:glycosyltransferase family 2 protein [Hyphomicrobium sp.]
MHAQSPIDVSILVVSYNTRALTAAALDSVLAETRATTYEIIAVDNASGDGSADMLAHHPASAKVIALTENIGFARANNLAAKSARGRYILLLNPDTVVLDGAIDKLVAFAQARPNARIWGGRTLFADGTLNPSSCWGRMTPWNLFCRASGLTGLLPHIEVFNGEAYGGWPRDLVREVDIVSGCFFLIERELWNGLDGFDPLFFMYGEEADLCLRAHAFSARPAITPEAAIIHYGGASERARTDKMVRLLAAKASLIARHWPSTTAPLGRMLLAAWPLSRAIATRIAGTLTGASDTQQSAKVWREIWDRRAEWQHGYSAHTLNPAAPSVLATAGQ